MINNESEKDSLVFDKINHSAFDGLRAGDTILMGDSECVIVKSSVLYFYYEKLGFRKFLINRRFKRKG